jgi:hypothetical protein
MTEYCGEGERNEGSGGSRCFLCARTTANVEVEKDENESEGDKDEDKDDNEDNVDQDGDGIASELRYLSLLEILKNDPAAGPRADAFRPSVASGADCFGWFESGCQNYKFVSKADKSTHHSVIHNLRADNRPKVGAAPKGKNGSGKSGVVDASAPGAIPCNWKHCGLLFSSRHFLAKHKTATGHIKGRGKAHALRARQIALDSDSSSESQSGGDSDCGASGRGGRSIGSGGPTPTNKSTAAAAAEEVRSRPPLRCAEDCSCCNSRLPNLILCFVFCCLFCLSLLFFGGPKRALVASSEEDGREEDGSEEGGSEEGGSEGLKRALVASSDEDVSEEDSNEEGGSGEDGSEENSIEENEGCDIGRHEGDDGSEEEEEEPVAPLNKRQRKSVIRIDL